MRVEYASSRFSADTKHEMLGAVRCETSADRNSVPLGPHASLVGLPLSTFEVRTGTESFVRLEDPSQFDDVNVGNHTLPLYVRGMMTDGDGKRVSLAIAVNGAVVATTQSYLEHDEWVFASMIPEAALTPGANDVRVFIVDGAGEKPLLTSATRAQVNDPQSRRAAQRLEGVIEEDPCGR